MQALLIVNPFSSNVTERRLREIEEVLQPARTALTEARGHASELAAGAGEGEAILVYGGDGSANEALNGLSADVPVGLLPGGGANVLARALGVPRDPVEAARRLREAIEQGRTRRISLGRVNGRRFGFAAGVGFDAELIRRVDGLGRAADGRRPGDLAYITAALALVAGRRGRFDPAVDLEGFGRAAFVLVSNCDPYTYAGRVPVRVTPEAQFELGLDLVAPAEVGPLDVPRLLRYILSGRGQAGARDVHYGHDLDRVEATCDHPLPLQADGEDLGDVDHAVFEAERDAVSVLV